MSAPKRLGRGASSVPGICLMIGLLLTAAVPSHAAAQEEQQARVTSPTQAISPPSRAEEPGRLGEQGLSLAEAVQLTLRYDPRIQTERQAVASSLGVFQQASGTFDNVIVWRAPVLQYNQQPIFPFLRTKERKKRELLDTIYVSNDAAREGTETALTKYQNGGLWTAPPCPAGLDNVLINLTGAGTSEIERRQQSGRTGLSSSDAFNLPGSQLFVSDINDLLNICGPRPQFTAVSALQRISTTIGPDTGLEEFFDLLFAGVFEIQEEALILQKEVYEAVSQKALLAYRRQAEVPDGQTNKSLSIEAGYLRSFRNGIDFSIGARFTGTEQNFIDKSLDPSFGGMGVQNQFPSGAAASLDVPLGKGRGKVSTAANERSADVRVGAQRDSLRHTMSEEVFGTVLAYINLIAAQRGVGYLEESAARQQRLVELTEELVRAGDQARTQLDRARARAAAVNRGVADARVTVLEAQYVLANAIGLEVEDPSQAPVATDSFRETIRGTLDLPALLEEATAQRKDLSSAHRAREAARILADAARADLKRQIDFSISGGVSTLYESPFFKVFPDELDSPTESAAWWYSPRGLLRSVDGAWSPFVSVSFTVDFPVANNVARGRLLRERSTLRSSDIQAADLGRVIRDNVVDIAGAAQRARQVVERRQEAVGYYEQILDATQERYRAGDLTLLNVITTEEDLTTAQVALVQALQLYWSLFARLKFEAGHLVDFSDEGAPMESIAFDPTELVLQE